MTPEQIKILLLNSKDPCKEIAECSNEEKSKVKNFWIMVWIITVVVAIIF